ncbi:hypothetical protein [Streptomyces sp. TS71-3]|uniref:hypothetical protein n=1 Tax=Streptomyces sp. TS71-3 TaxID=2733862 RepID=UPI001B2AA766|nr:hypothetical protein [Streptomyces sp. TS71-3]GHJ36203.1 hypothetical protein Sm713_18120 [Streptomyces sp. TS71-3]
MPSRVFLTAVALFTLGSACAGLAWDAGSLIAFRFPGRAAAAARRTRPVAVATRGLANTEVAAGTTADTIVTQVSAATGTAPSALLLTATGGFRTTLLCEAALMALSLPAALRMPGVLRMPGALRMPGVLRMPGESPGSGKRLGPGPDGRSGAGEPSGG